jgi:hypothetical protein
MNDNDLSAALSAIHEDRMGLPAPPSLHRSAWAVPDSQTPHQRGWLPRIFTGRFQSKFSATKFVAAGVIVALAGGFLLSGVLTTQQGDEMVPAAASPAPAALVTGSEDCTYVDTGTVTYEADGIERTRGQLIDCEMTASDPRFAGVAKGTFNTDCHLMPDRRRDCIFFGTSTKTTDDGVWECAWTGPQDPTVVTTAMVVQVCSGVGGYAGLSYVGHWVWEPSRWSDRDLGDGSSHRGYIYEGDLPPLLEFAVE